MKYQVVNIRTVFMKEEGESGLSFLEGEHDIPFGIKRMYCIYETENHRKGFHPNKQSWQLLFCPYGAIKVLIDDGEKRENVLLDDPSKGLILNPGIWREISWEKSNSVLCVAASGHYEPEKLRTNYNMYLEFRKNGTILTQHESEKLLGEVTK